MNSQVKPLCITFNKFLSIQVSEVTKKTCRLSWKMPEDDGGHPLQPFEIEKLDPNLDQWLPVGKTKGTSFDVKNLSEGKSYKFLVRAVNKEGDSPDLVTEEAIVAKDPFDPPSPPLKESVHNTTGALFSDLAVT